MDENKTSAALSAALALTSDELSCLNDVHSDMVGEETSQDDAIEWAEAQWQGWDQASWEDAGYTGEMTFAAFCREFLL